MEGLIGLTQGPDKTEQSYRDLATLGQLEQKMQMDKQREMMAAQQEAAVFDKLYEQADTMLEKDKKKVNAKIRASQDMLRDTVAETGGSKAAFMENGGGTYLSEMYHGIVDSDEVNTYKENKKNLAMIMWAQQNNMGDRILPTDLQSMMNYNASDEGGKITYQGMMNEVKIPPANQFEFGKDIPTEAIMEYDGNMMRILANYKMMFPDRQMPNPNTMDGRRHLGNFVKSMGWGDTGSRMLTSSTSRGSGSGSGSGSSKDPQHAQTNNYATWLATSAKNIPMEQFLKSKEEGGFGGDLVGKYKEDGDQFTNQIFGDKAPLLSEQHEFDISRYDDNNALIPDGLEDILEGRWFKQNQFALKGGHEVFKGNEAKIAQRVFDGYKLDGRTIQDFQPTGDMFRNDGVKVGGDNYEKYRDNFEIVGTYSAIKAKGKEGKEKLLVDVYNDKNELDKELTQRNDEGYLGEQGGGTVKPTVVVGMRDSKGRVWYHEVDAETAAGLTQMSNAMGDDDNISDAVNMQNTSAQRIQAMDQLTAQQRAEYDTAMKKVAPVFQQENSPFDFERQKFFAPGSGGQQNRDKEMQSFYIAADAVMSGGKPMGMKQEERIQALTSSNLFSKMVADSPEKEQRLRDFEKYNSEELIQEWMNEANEGLESNSTAYKKNQEIALLWKQIMYQL